MTQVPVPSTPFTVEVTEDDVRIKRYGQEVLYWYVSEWEEDHELLPQIVVAVVEALTKPEVLEAKLVKMGKVKPLDFKSFQASGVDCDDLGRALKDESLKGIRGRLYCDKRLYIENTGSWPVDRLPPGKPLVAIGSGQWYTQIGRSDHQSDNLEQVEKYLYNFAKSEGYELNEVQPHSTSEDGNAGSEVEVDADGYQVDGITFIKPMAHWMKYHDLAAKKQGWSLFDADGVVAIHAIDEPEEGDAQLRNDTVALKLIIEQASTGDMMSLLALYLEGRDVQKECDLPDLLNKKRRAS